MLTPHEWFLQQVDDECIPTVEAYEAYVSDYCDWSVERDRYPREESP